MKYTIDTLRSAIFYLLPNMFSESRYSRPLNVPHLLKEIAVNRFMLDDDCELYMSTAQKQAYNICKDAIRDLHDIGYVVDGEVSITFTKEESLKF